jgi:hypothetical protein
VVRLTHVKYLTKKASNSSFAFDGSFDGPQSRSGFGDEEKEKNPSEK